MKTEGKPVPCEHGLHLCRKQDLIHWLGPEIYLAQAAGEIVEDKNKIVTNKARLIHKFDTWNETTARLFAADCAERVANGNETLLETIAVSRKFARGQVSLDDLAAAESAAYSAARYAAWSAVASAAWSAASAAWSAAWYAAESAARYAEREWQSERLFEYLSGVRS